MSALANLGVGALLAWSALPLLAWLCKPRVRADALSLHRAQLAVLAGAVALLIAPSLWWLAPAWWGPSAPYFALDVRTSLIPLASDGPFHGRGMSASLSLTALLGLGWSIAVAVAALRAALAWLALQRVLRHAVRAPAPLVDAVTALAASIGVRAPELRVAQSCAIPFVTGLLEPTLVLPRELVDSLDPSALELVIEHELEHVRRGDLRMAALFTGFQIALGGHPTAQRAAREAMLAREVAVDARVSRHDARAYASLLVEIASHAHFGERLGATAIDDTALARRIASIAEPAATRPLSSLPVWAAATLIAAAACFGRTAVHIPGSEPFMPPLRVERGLRLAGPGAPGFAGGFGHGHKVMFVHAPGHAFDGRPPPDGLPPPPPGPPLALERSPEIRACYERAAASNRELEIAAMFELELDAAGNVVSASVEVPELPSLEPCLEQAALKLPRAPEVAHPPQAARFGVGMLLGPRSPRN